MAEHIYGVKPSKYGKFRISLKLEEACVRIAFWINVFLNNAALGNVQRINVIEPWTVAARACLYYKEDKI